MCVREIQTERRETEREREGERDRERERVHIRNCRTATSIRSGCYAADASFANRIHIHTACYFPPHPHELRESARHLEIRRREVDSEFAPAFAHVVEIACRTPTTPLRHGAFGRERERESV